MQVSNAKWSFMLLRCGCLISPEKEQNRLRWTGFYSTVITHCSHHLGPITYLWTGMNWSFLLTRCPALFCTQTLLREGTACRHCSILALLALFNATKYKVTKSDTKPAPQTVLLHDCTFLRLSSGYLLLNILLLSSVVRAMQGLMVMPGSMALDKDLGNGERDTHYTNSQ